LSVVFVLSVTIAVSLLSADVELPQPSMNGLTNGSTYEKLITTNITSQNDLTWPYAENMISGTYRIVLKLYDGNQWIDEDMEYIIVKK